MSIELKSTVTIDGKEYEAELGTVRDTYIGFEDHNIFSWNINFGFGGSVQGTGHRFMEAEVALPTIKRIIEISSDRSWEKLTGQSFLVLREDRMGPIKGLVNPHTQGYILL